MEKAGIKNFVRILWSVGERERTWKTEDKWVSGRVLIIVGNIEHV